VSLEGDSLISSYYLGASEICPYKRGTAATKLVITKYLTM